MSSQQFPLVLRPVNNEVVTAEAWTPPGPRARRCADCERHVPPGHTAQDGTQRCNDCVEPHGVDR